MDSVVTEAVSQFPRILWWEVWNFMSIERGKCEYDERNIINLKGYNDSGKSAMLNALKVALFNSNPTKQVSFIQDDKEYFRVLIAFEDGVQILRDKYINGQSLYEMYKDGKCIYTSKNGNALTRITEVPKPIADYLGLIMYDGSCLNARACFEKQIGVQTTGSENYKMFNAVLKSEEIATAGVLLNNDKNKLASDIEATDYELQAHKRTLGDSEKLTEDMISYLKLHDADLDTLEMATSALSNITNLNNMYSSVRVLPEMSTVDFKQLDALIGLVDLVTKSSAINLTPELGLVDNIQLQSLSGVVDLLNKVNSISVTPQVSVIDSNRLSALTDLSTMISTYDLVKVAPKVSGVDSSQLSDLEIISKIMTDLQFYTSEIESNDSRLTVLADELVKLQAEVANHGVKMIKCPGCGQIFNPDEQHIH